jgi:predicted dehydrogenase
MGQSHALAYHRNPGFEVIGFVNRTAVPVAAELDKYRKFDDFEAALAEKPNLVSVNTYTETHAAYAIAAMEAGAHVFVEKPLAPSVVEAQRVVATARRTRRKLVIGYILRHHPSYVEFIQQARKVGSPVVMRMNLNQQSSGNAWEIHKRLMQSTSPLVDCCVHYIDVMLQICDSRPVQVRGMGVRLSSEIAEAQVNYGHLQVVFADGSVGWYEAGWGPMISETAYFVKDVMGPRGSVSIVMDEGAASASVDTHTKTARIRLHNAATNASGAFVECDEVHSMHDEPSHQQLCEREQQFVLDAIRADVDLDKHMQDAIRSLTIVLAAERSMHEQRAVDL